MRVIYHPDAEKELLEAVQFYEGRRQGLGDRFLREFEATVSEIQQTPHLWPVVEGNLRRYVMDWFPFQIYYSLEGDDLRVLVIRHHSRHPDYWRYRLRP